MLVVENIPSPSPGMTPMMMSQSIHGAFTPKPPEAPKRSKSGLDWVKSTPAHRKQIRKLDRSVERSARKYNYFYSLLFHRWEYLTHAFLLNFNHTVDSAYNGLHWSSLYLYPQYFGINGSLELKLTGHY